MPQLFQNTIPVKKWLSKFSFMIKVISYSAFLLYSIDLFSRHGEPSSMKSARIMSIEICIPPQSRCLYLTHYTRIQINNSFKSTSINKVAKLRMISIMNGNHHVLTTKSTLLMQTKMKGTQRRILVSPSKMHFTFNGMVKGTSWAEVTLHEQRLIALAIVKLH